MIILLLAIHIMVAVALVGVVLLQKSEGGALGMGGGGMSGFMTGRSTANLLTRATAILAATFMATSTLLVVLHNRERAPVSIIDQGGPAAPAGPTVPLAPAAPPAPVGTATPSKPAAPANTAVPANTAAPRAPSAPAAPQAPAAPSPPLAH